MNHKKLIYGGLLLLSASFVIPSFAGIWFFHDAFEALRTNQTAGIGAVGGGILTALVISFFGLIGFVIGTILLVVGFMKANRQAKTEN